MQQIGIKPSQLLQSSKRKKRTEKMPKITVMQMHLISAVNVRYQKLVLKKDPNIAMLKTKKQLKQM